MMPLLHPSIKEWHDCKAASEDKSSCLGEIYKELKQRVVSLHSYDWKQQR